MLATYFHSIFPKKDRQGHYLVDYKNRKMEINGIFEMIKTSSYLKEKIQNLRKLDYAEYKRKKKTLPAFSTCIFHDNIKINSKFKSCKAIVFDIDNLSDKKLQQLREYLIGCQWLYFCFISPGGKGLKFGVLFDKEITDSILYSKIYSYLIERFQLILSVKLDRTLDPARACLFSFDEKIFVNDQVLPIPLQSLQNKITSKKIERKTKRSEIMRNIDKERILLYVQYFVLEMIKNKIYFNYHLWYRFGFILATELGQAGRKSFLEYSLSNKKYSKIDTELSLNDDYDNFLNSCANRIHTGSLFYLAKESGVKIQRFNEFLTLSENDKVQNKVELKTKIKYEEQVNKANFSVSEDLVFFMKQKGKEREVVLYYKEQKTDIINYLLEDYMFTDEISVATGISCTDILAFNNALSRGIFGKELQMEALKRKIL